MVVMAILGYHMQELELWFHIMRNHKTRKKNIKIKCKNIKRSFWVHLIQAVLKIKQGKKFLAVALKFHIFGKGEKVYINIYKYKYDHASRSVHDSCKIMQ